MPRPPYDVREGHSQIVDMLKRFNNEYERLEAENKAMLAENAALRTRVSCEALADCKAGGSIWASLQKQKLKLGDAIAKGDENGMQKAPACTDVVVPPLELSKVEPAAEYGLEDTYAPTDALEPMTAVPSAEVVVRRSVRSSDSREAKKGTTMKSLKNQATRNYTALARDDLNDAEKAELDAKAIIEEANRYTSPAVRMVHEPRLTAHQRASTEVAGPWTVKMFAEHHLFDSLCAFVILLNSVIIGWETEWNTQYDTENQFTVVIGHLCSAFFLFELIIRICALRSEFIFGENVSWNMFDFVLVMLSIVDLIIVVFLGSKGSGFGSSMKTIKMLRIIRLFRVFRFFRELSLLALMIIDSLKSLVWALIMLTIILYVFAICFTQMATATVKELNLDPDSPTSLKFGRLARTVYSLVQAMLGGVSWGELSDVLLNVSVFSAGLFFFYILFTMLAVLNIVTGVFVDNAVQMARSQRDFLTQQEVSMKEKYVAEMRLFFEMMDEDNTGTVNVNEVAKFFQDTRMQAYFSALGLGVEDTERLFHILDTDGSGEVEADEFLEGCLRIRGEARSIDIHQIMIDIRRLHDKVDHVQQHVLNECEDE